MPRQERRKDRTVPVEQVIGARGGLTTEVVQSLISTVDYPETFLELSDVVPTSYTGEDGKLVGVSSDSLVFVSLDVHGERGVEVGDVATTTSRVFTISLANKTARVVSITNLDLSGTETIDGVAVSVGEVVLCVNQATASQNGPWVVSLTGWTRPDSLEAFVYPGEQWTIREGTSFSDTVWQLSNNTDAGVDSDSQTWRRIDGKLVMLLATDANYTVPQNVGRVMVCFPNLTANRVMTLPTATGYNGQEIYVQIQAAVGATRQVSYAATGLELLNNNAATIGPWSGTLWTARAGNWTRIAI